MRAARSSARGATLIEALLAVVVVATGAAATTELLKYISDATRRMAFQSAALDVYADVVTQIEDARCNVDADGNFQRDPGLTALLAAPNTWHDGGVPNSLIGRLGDIRPFDPVTGGPDPRARSIPLNVQIRALPVAAWTPTTVRPPAYEFEIRVRELTGDPVKDAPAREDGYWIRIYPAKKVCNFRSDGTSRGETY